MDHWWQIRLALRTAAGSICLLTLFYWVQDFLEGPRKANIQSVLAILLVLLIIMAFLEPMKSMIRNFLDHHPEEEVIPQEKTYQRILAILITVITGFFMGLYTSKLRITLGESPTNLFWQFLPQAASLLPGPWEPGGLHFMLSGWGGPAVLL